MLDVNALGVLRVCQVIGATMAGNGRGSIVNIGSLYGSVGPDPRLYDHIDLDPPFLKPPAYGMSKAAVAALTRYLAALWGPAVSGSTRAHREACSAVRTRPSGRSSPTGCRCVGWPPRTT